MNNRFLHRSVRRPILAAPLFALAVLGALELSILPAPAKTPKPKEEAYKQSYDVVQSVNATAHTVTIDTMVKFVDANAQALARAKIATPIADAPAKVEKSVTLAVTKFSEVIVNGKAADLTALHAGMKVSITKGTTETEAARISATE